MLCIAHHIPRSESPGIFFVICVFRASVINERGYHIVRRNTAMGKFVKRSPISHMNLLGFINYVFKHKSTKNYYEY